MDDNKQLFSENTQENIADRLKPNMVPNAPTQEPIGFGYQSTSSFPLWAAALMAVLIAGGILLTWRSLGNQSTKGPIVTPTPSQTPTPTPLRELSALASQSAFISLKNEVARVTTTVADFVVEDPSLSPPILDLPLGFSR